MRILWEMTVLWRYFTVLESTVFYNITLQYANTILVGDVMKLYLRNNFWKKHMINLKRFDFRSLLNWWGMSCFLLLSQHDTQMSVKTSWFTCLSIVCSADCSGWLQRKHQSSSSLAFCEGNPQVTCGFPSQRGSNTENVSLSWRHHHSLQI